MAMLSKKKKKNCTRVCIYVYIHHVVLKACNTMCQAKKIVMFFPGKDTICTVREKRLFFVQANTASKFLGQLLIQRLDISNKKISLQSFVVLPAAGT